MKAQLLIRLFSDVDGETVELFGYISGMERAEFSARFPGITGRRYDSRRMQVAADASGRVRPVTRSIEFKKTRTPKRCDARCLYARGHDCECACGGVNHGRGDAGAQNEMFGDSDSVPAAAGFHLDTDARVEAAAADFALEFMGGSLELGGEQLIIDGVGGNLGEVVQVDPRQTKLF